jgi:hypothetical protein
MPRQPRARHKRGQDDTSGKEGSDFPAHAEIIGILGVED